MAEILGLGVSHYPPLSGLDEDMANAHRGRLNDPDIPATAKDPIRSRRCIHLSSKQTIEARKRKHAP